MLLSCTSCNVVSGFSAVWNGFTVGEATRTVVSFEVAPGEIRT